MLKRTDTTRTDLTQEELAYLIRVRTALETGKITPEHFNMGQIWCGTAGCIGGWMGFFWMEDHKNKSMPLGGLYQFIYEQKFKSLFYPIGWKMEAAGVTEGIVAINNFLADKARPWSHMTPKKYPEAYARYHAHLLHLQT